jgi:hypothetical protein
MPLPIAIAEAAFWIRFDVAPVKRSGFPLSVYASAPLANVSVFSWNGFAMFWKGPFLDEAAKVTDVVPLLAGGTKPAQFNGSLQKFVKPAPD